MSNPEQSYPIAKETYAQWGVDTEQALATLTATPISMHCWQGDDVGGFESKDEVTSGGGIQATGNYPGRARTIEELRQDAEKAMSLIPGKHRFALHASYGDFGGQKVDRAEVGPEHFQSWIEWARSNGIGLDFNPTYFAHPKADDGFTLSHQDKGIRDYWINHGIACRRIGETMGRELGTPCVNNHWIPDGYKDVPFDRKSPRERLEDSLDKLFAAPFDCAHNQDAIESKLFGIGVESYTVGSHEFYLGYAVKNQKILCLDAGHFHPTESLADKISCVLQFVPGLLLHVSRGVRWDSDHVVLFDDPTKAIAEELVRGNFLSKTAIGLDFFDASINRIAAWVIGTRNALRSVLLALLEPASRLREVENNGDYTARLMMLEEIKNLPFGAVWDEHCRRQNVPCGLDWLSEVKSYERNVLMARG